MTTATISKLDNGTSELASSPADIPDFDPDDPTGIPKADADTPKGEQTGILIPSMSQEVAAWDLNYTLNIPDGQHQNYSIHTKESQDTHLGSLTEATAKAQGYADVLADHTRAGMNDPYQSGLVACRWEITHPESGSIVATDVSKPPKIQTQPEQVAPQPVHPVPINVNTTSPGKTSRVQVQVGAGGVRVETDNNGNVQVFETGSGGGVSIVSSN